MAALRGAGRPPGGSTRRSWLCTAELEWVITDPALFLLRALPDHAGKTFQRHQRLAGIGPFLQFLDRDVIERLAAGTIGKQRAGNVEHMRRARALVDQGRAATLAKAAPGLGRRILEMRNIALAARDAKALAPASDIGRIGRAMGAPACLGMIVPGPARRNIDLERNMAAKAFTLGDACGFGGFGH